ncbi:MAG: transketolase [Coriobacteriales bacterium]|jgi:transketolase
MGDRSTAAPAGFDADRVRAAAAQMRRDIVTMLEKAGSGHPGGSLSATDIIATLYFGGVLRHDPSDPQMPGRDRFILSKGHAAPALYAALAQDGYFPREWLDTLRKLGSHLQGHPDMRKCPGVEVSTGSLGQGLAVGSGMALGMHRDWARGDSASPAGREPQVFVMMGDGELQEGEVWEAAMFAASRRLPNLVAIVDNNTLQIDGHLDDVVSLGDICAKFSAFGWYTIDLADGNDVVEANEALTRAVAYDAGPVAIVAHTIKGKGVSFMEDQVGWHGKAPSAEQLAQALADIDAAAGVAERKGC